MGRSSINGADGPSFDGEEERRKTHTKSRFGCKRCKQRRIKCDERRPSCGNCTKSRLQCPYLVQTAVLPASASVSAPASIVCPSPVSSPPPSREKWPGASTAHPSPAHFSEEQAPCLAGDSYSLCHLELLHHFQSRFGPSLGSPETLPGRYLELIVKLGFTAPYLMDEILGLAAAHKSTTVDAASSKEYYRREATRLQTRALAQFSAMQPGAGDNDPLSVFLFSTLLGQHVLFDTFSSEDDFPVILDRFVHCLGLHRGIRTIVGGSFATILAQIEEHHGPDSVIAKEMTAVTPTGDDRGDDCAALSALLRESHLGDMEAEAYAHAVETLQHMFDNQRSSEASPYRRFTVVQEWPVRVSSDYVRLLAQRRPEALVILAYYGMLLHNARRIWAVAGAGRVIIESITSHLGTYWAEWLDTPNRMIRSGT